jgi:hypothetical protein
MLHRSEKKSDCLNERMKMDRFGGAVVKVVSLYAT